jgi:hypothetical protein
MRGQGRTHLATEALADLRAATRHRQGQLGSSDRASHSAQDQVITSPRPQITSQRSSTPPRKDSRYASPSPSAIDTL